MALFLFGITLIAAASLVLGYLMLREIVAVTQFIRDCEADEIAAMFDAPRFTRRTIPS